jgi:hypothetical protein
MKWKKPTPYTVSLSGCLYEAKLWSRKVWQELFNLYRRMSGNLHELDSLLCDLYFLERELEIGMKGRGFDYWFALDESGYTNWQSFQDDHHNIHVVWKFGGKEIKITVY